MKLVKVHCWHFTPEPAEGATSDAWTGSYDFLGFWVLSVDLVCCSRSFLSCVILHHFILSPCLASTYSFTLQTHHTFFFSQLFPLHSVHACSLRFLFLTLPPSRLPPPLTPSHAFCFCHSAISFQYAWTGPWKGNGWGGATSWRAWPTFKEFQFPRVDHRMNYSLAAFSSRPMFTCIFISNFTTSSAHLCIWV